MIKPLQASWKKDPIEGAQYYFSELLISLCETIARECLNDEALAQATLLEASKRAKARDEGVELNPYWEYFEHEENDGRSSVEKVNEYIQRITVSFDEYKMTGDDEVLVDAFMAFDDILLHYGLFFVLDMDIVDCQK